MITQLEAKRYKEYLTKLTRAVNLFLLNLDEVMEHKESVYALLGIAL